jgi:hypothetical protein
VTIPAVIVPTFLDGDVLPAMLRSIALCSRQPSPFLQGRKMNDSSNKNMEDDDDDSQSPSLLVERYFFVWNSEDDRIGMLLHDLEDAAPAGAVTVMHHPENLGFAGSVNRALALAFSSSSLLPVGLSKAPFENTWALIVNPDVVFSGRALHELAMKMSHATNLSFSSSISSPARRIGLGYFSHKKRDHHAFAVTKEAVEAAGTMDENFYPAYYEDIDWRWRINLAGFDDASVAGDDDVKHSGSLNLNRGGRQRHLALVRSGFGAFYFQAKWAAGLGVPVAVDPAMSIPVAGGAGAPPPHRNPFGIAGLSFAVWATDPARISCIRNPSLTSSEEEKEGLSRRTGVMHRETGVCWYNGSALAPYLISLTSGEASGKSWRAAMPLVLREPLSRGYSSS